MDIYTNYAGTVYDRCMSRTNIEIDDRVLETVMRRYGLSTKTEAVDMALRHLAGQPMTIAEVLEMRGFQGIRETPDDRFDG